MCANTVATIEAVQDTNVKGPRKAIHPAKPKMLEQGNGLLASEVTSDVD